MAETNVQTAYTSPNSCKHMETVRHRFESGIVFIVMIETRKNKNLFALTLPRHVFITN